MRFFLGTKFVARGAGHPIDLISVALVRQHGEAYYAISADFAASAGAADVVGSVVDPRPVAVIAAEVAAFVEEGCGEEAPEFWSAYGDFDWVVLMQLVGGRPARWPIYCRALAQWAETLRNPPVPRLGPGQNALADARHNLAVWEALDEHERLRAHQRRMWFDESWRSAMAGAFANVVAERLDFAVRFGRVATAHALSAGESFGDDDVGLPGHSVSYIAGGDVERQLGEGADSFDGAFFGLQVRTDMAPEDLETWEVECEAATAAEFLAAGIWAVIGRVLQPVATASSPAELEMLGPSLVAIGPGVVDGFDVRRVPTPDVVDATFVLDPSRLHVVMKEITSGERLDASGWHLELSVEVLAALVDGRARRYVG